MEQANSLLGTPLVEIAGSGITLGAIITAIFIFMAALVTAWLVRRLVRRAQTRLGAERAPAIYIGGQVLRYLVVFVGLAVAISALGVDLSALSLFAGALGVGIGLGLQDVVRNFVCGVVLLFDRTVEVGDYVELDTGTQGLVSGIGPRAMTLRTNDNVHILVPNMAVMNGQLINWTRNRTTRRVRIPFRVPLGTDKEQVRAAVLAAARTVPFTLPEDDVYRTQVWLVGFGESGLDFDLAVWPSLEAVKRPGAMKAAYYWAIDDALRAQGIQIPVPRRDVQMRGASEQAAAESGGSIGH
ncbi:MAG TPA: mechanosensitive ion channel domain-containing protein [Sphingobium sp.]|nr:mechanosensitive ion channel domain-containing protein [Sphingobium sp.]